MTNRSIVVRLRADIAGFKASFRDAAEQAKQVGQAIDKSSRSWDDIGNKATIAGAAMAAGLGVAAKAAIDWETAWTGVTKTVDGTPAQMAELEQGLRSLAKTLPATHGEIAAVAEAAGQLGVKRADVLGFTKTMVDLGESTNLTADEAATSIAQISNVMGTMQRDGTKGVERFGAALVELGNNGASTERDILQMASRIAGAAKVVGMSEADLLAISNALASVGVEAEAGGSAVSRVLMDMSKAVKTGSKDLDAFARVAGMSTKAWSELFAKSPAEAFNAFIQGLGRIKDAGGDVFTTLDNLGQQDVRVTTSLLKMAGAGDLLTQSLQDGRTAWEQNTALATEAEKRYATTASQLAMARNAAKDAAIDFGSVLAPAMKTLAENAASAAGWLAGLPEPVKSAGMYAATGAAGLLLFGGGALKAATSGYELYKSVKQLREDLPALAGGLDKVGKAATVAAKAYAVLQAAAILSGTTGENTVGVEKLTSALLGSSSAASAFNRVLADGSKLGGIYDGAITDIGTALDAAFDPGVAQQIDNVGGSILKALGGRNSSDIARAKDQFTELGEALAQMVQGGHADRAKQIFDEIAAGASRAGYNQEQLMTLLGPYAEALAAVDNQTTLTKDGTAGLAGEIDGMGGAADGATSDINDLADAVTNLGTAVLTQRDAARGFYAAWEDMKKTIAENGNVMNATGEAIDITTEKGRESEAALDAMAAATLRSSGELLRIQGTADGARAKMQEGRDAFIAAALAAGYSEEKAKALADQLDLIPENVQTNVSTPGADAANTKMQTLTGYVNGLPPYATTQVKVNVYGLANLQQAYNLITSMNAQGGRVAIAGYSTHGGSTINADGGMWDLTSGRLVKAYAAGGIHSIGSQAPQIRSAGGRGILWAEDGAGPWESFISGHPAKAARSQAIWRETGRRLGADPSAVSAVQFEHGGIYGSSSMSRTGRAANPASIEVFGTLDTPWGPAQVRGIVRDELSGVAARMSTQGGRG